MINFPRTWLLLRTWSANFLLYELRNYRSGENRPTRSHQHRSYSKQQADTSVQRLCLRLLSQVTRPLGPRGSTLLAPLLSPSPSSRVLAPHLPRRIYPLSSLAHHSSSIVVYAVSRAPRGSPGLTLTHPSPLQPRSSGQFGPAQGGSSRPPSWV